MLDASSERLKIASVLVMILYLLPLVVRFPRGDADAGRRRSEDGILEPTPAVLCTRWPPVEPCLNIFCSALFASWCFRMGCQGFASRGRRLQQSDIITHFLGFEILEFFKAKLLLPFQAANKRNCSVQLREDKIFLRLLLRGEKRSLLCARRFICARIFVHLRLSVVWLLSSRASV